MESTSPGGVCGEGHGGDEHEVWSGSSTGPAARGNPSTRTSAHCSIDARPRRLRREYSSVLFLCQRSCYCCWRILVCASPFLSPYARLQRCYSPWHDIICWSTSTLLSNLQELKDTHYVYPEPKRQGQGSRPLP